MMRALFERTQHINVSEESEDDDDDDDGKEGGNAVGAFENIFRSEGERGGMRGIW